MNTLEAINQVLLMSGERQVRDISSPPAIKAKDTLVVRFGSLYCWTTGHS